MQQDDRMSGADVVVMDPVSVGLRESARGLCRDVGREDVSETSPSNCRSSKRADVERAGDVIEFSVASGDVCAACGDGS